ncbi:MAG TPA: transcriptional repressor [Geminicoccaceae bacterium]|nr:transcriptional repressor [Geminicoccaceae bacterium]
MASPLERLCLAQGIKLTAQRRVIAGVLSAADDRPDVEELYRRASRIDGQISLATVYRTLRLFEEAGVVARRDLGDGRARYEPRRDRAAADGTGSGEVVAFPKPGGRVADDPGRHPPGLGHPPDLRAAPVGAAPRGRIDAP